MTRSKIALDEPGLRLKSIRERLDLRFRDVEEASYRIAAIHKNDEFCIAISRLADIENKGVTPSIYRLYTLCSIYRQDVEEVLAWYGVDLSQMPADSRVSEIGKTHAVKFKARGEGEVTMPLALDPGFDIEETSFFSRVVQRWGKVPLLMLQGLDVRHNSYGYIGSSDFTMYPVLQPGAFVLIDETKRKVVNGIWRNEFERPIYFVETREAFYCGWCTLSDGQLTILAHPSSGVAPRTFEFDSQAEIIGQVIGVASLLEPRRRRKES
jgi:transcriptional regulator with XRE-family HTH domain